MRLVQLGILKFGPGGVAGPMIYRGKSRAAWVGHWWWVVRAGDTAGILS